LGLFSFRENEKEGVEEVVRKKQKKNKYFIPTRRRCR